MNILERMRAYQKDPAGYKKQEKLKQEYKDKGSKSGIERVQSGTRSFKVGPDGRGSKPAYKYIRTTPEPNNSPAAPAPEARTPTNTQLQQSNDFSNRLEKIQADNRKQTDSLLKQMEADRSSYEELTSKYQKSIESYQKSFNQGSSVGGQESALMINPAQSTATKKKKLSKGTSQFNRNLKISNVSI